MASSSQAVPQGKLNPSDLPSGRCLGKGLSGIIYETEWLGKTYARKDFPLGSRRHNHVFEEEAKPLFDLDHPNIVKCFGYTIGKSSCSLVQEYVDDNLQSTMEKRIEARRKDRPSQSRVLDIKDLMKETEGSKACESTVAFELPEAIAIISQIASAMEFLHDHRVAHGDLKPNNVLLSWESGVMKVKVTDFGFIETKKRIKMVSKRARHLEILTWKAPERLEKLLGPETKNSNDPFTESDTNSDESRSFENFKKSKMALADVYSFGLTCVHILGEELMHPDLSLKQLREKRTSPGFKHKLPSACPEYLEILIHSILEFEYYRRPSFSYICKLLETFHVPPLSGIGNEVLKDSHFPRGNNESNEGMKRNAQSNRVRKIALATQGMQDWVVVEKDGHVVGGMKKERVSMQQLLTMAPHVGEKKKGRLSMQQLFTMAPHDFGGMKKERVSMQELLTKVSHVGGTKERISMHQLLTMAPVKN